MKKECPNYDADWQENEEAMNERMRIIAQNGNTGEHYVSCPMCSHLLLLGNDFMYEDYGRDDDGIVAEYTCTNEECHVDSVTIYTNIE